VRSERTATAAAAAAVTIGATYPRALKGQVSEKTSCRKPNIRETSSHSHSCSANFLGWWRVGVWELDSGINRSHNIDKETELEKVVREQPLPEPPVQRCPERIRDGPGHTATSRRWARVASASWDC
jgi:hypothetical protein